MEQIIIKRRHVALIDNKIKTVESIVKYLIKNFNIYTLRYRIDINNLILSFYVKYVDKNQNTICEIQFILPRDFILCVYFILEFQLHCIFGDIFMFLYAMYVRISKY